MDEKRVLMAAAGTAPYRGRPARRARPFLTLVLVCLGLFVCLQIRPLADIAAAQLKNQGGSRGGDSIGGPSRNPTATVAKPVPLEAHIMSKCPDARDCLREMILPAMQQVSDKVNFTLSFIGTTMDGDDGVNCKHGPAECLGNIIELCAKTLYPDPKIYLGFTMCLTKNYEMIPQRSLIEDCALEHALSFSKLNECATKDDGAFGIGMLRSSVLRSAEAGVTKSCTVRLNEEIYCVRDGGEWTSCPSGPAVKDLVAAIENQYSRSSA